MHPCPNTQEGRVAAYIDVRHSRDARGSDGDAVEGSYRDNIHAPGLTEGKGSRVPDAFRSCR